MATLLYTRAGFVTIGAVFITHARPRSMSKQRRLTAWLNTREGEPPAKHGRQDTENDAEAVSDSSATLDSTLLSSSSDASALRSGGGTPPSWPVS